MEKEELVSAVLDGQIHNTETIKEVSNDKEALKVVSRYSLIGSIMRNEAPKSINKNFMDAFEEKFAKEPIVMAPMKSNKYSGSLNNSKDLKEDNVIPFYKSSWFKYVTQTAIAASVAFMSIVGVNFYINYDGKYDAVLNTTPYGGIASPVSAKFNSNSENPLQINTNHQYQTQSRDMMNRSISSNEMSQVSALLQDHQYQIKITQVDR